MKIRNLIRKFIKKTNIYEKLPYPFVAVVRQVFNLGFDRLRQIFNEDNASKREEFFSFLNRFGITEVYLSDVSLKDAGWIEEKNEGQSVRITRSRGEDPKKVYKTTALSFRELFKGFSISDIDEMIWINVSNLASGYDKILFLKAGNVGDEIVRLLGRANCHNMSGALEWTHIRLRTIPFKPGDTVVLMAGVLTDGSEKLFKKAGVEVLSLKECYEGIDPKEYIWDIPYHSNSRMNKRTDGCLYGEI